MRKSRWIIILALAASLIWAAAQSHVGTHELEHFVESKLQFSPQIATDEDTEDCPFCALAHHVPGCVGSNYTPVPLPFDLILQTVPLYISLSQIVAVVLPPQRGPPAFMI